MKTPILLLTFNRPDKTQIVFDVIKEVRPEQLFMACDGPRKDKPEDEKLCKETREIINQVDWPCRVHTLFRDENLGCKYGVSSAITWFFENVEEGIILEDDCVPNQIFFEFMTAMLETYRNIDKIASISGTNYFGQFDNNYFLSKYGSIWGWATWKRSWGNYDSKMINWNDKNKNKIKAWLGKKSFDRLSSFFDKVKNDKINSWGYVWLFSRIYKEQYSIVPSKNLIKNIGFDETATHTKYNKKYSKTKVFDDFKFTTLKNFEDTKINNEYDKLYVKKNISNIWISFKKIIKMLLGFNN